jgi:molybdopterin adenylyltransferase
MSLPHSDQPILALTCAVLTVSDSRTPETDRSGQLLQYLLKTAGHRVGEYRIVPDEPDRIHGLLGELELQADLAVLIFSGGTGIAPRDRTYEVLSGRLDKQLPGFGELFRWLSFEEIGSRTIASRALAGVLGQKLVFSLPGSTGGVRLAMERLILPELIHLHRLVQDPLAAAE